jgi:hypothetical protein
MHIQFYRECRKRDSVLDRMQGEHKYKQKPDNKTKESMSGNVNCN